MDKKYPFPMYIEAHSGSSVVVGCSGQTSIGGGGTATNEMEMELLKVFRGLSMRDRVEVMQCIYKKQKSSLYEGA